MANGHGGARPNAGRKKGSLSKLTEDAVARAQEGGILPLDYMLQVLRDVQEDSSRRLDAAKAAAPYLHPRLANIEGDIRVAAVGAALDELDDADDD